MSDIKTVFIRLFGISPQLRLIDFFMDNPNHDFTNREIMEAVRMAKTTLYKYLPRLLKADVIKISRKIGRAHFYTLNSGSPTTQLLIGLDAELTKPAGNIKAAVIKLAEAGLERERATLDPEIEARHGGLHDTTIGQVFIEIIAAAETENTERLNSLIDELALELPDIAEEIRHAMTMPISLIRQIFYG